MIKESWEDEKTYRPFYRPLSTSLLELRKITETLSEGKELYHREVGRAFLYLQMYAEEFSDVGWVGTKKVEYFTITLQNTYKNATMII